jgi:hypothetical protein
MNVQPAPQSLRLGFDVTHILSGMARGKPSLARRGSPRVGRYFNVCCELNIPLSSRAKGPVPRPEGPTELSPGFTLGRRPQPDLGLKDRQKASLAFSAALSGLHGGEESFPRVNPGLRPAQRSIYARERSAAVARRDDPPEPQMLPNARHQLARRAPFRRPDGTRAGGGVPFPALKCRAKFNRPSGAKATPDKKGVKLGRLRWVRSLQPTIKMFGEAQARKAGAL